jgi:uncharacterized protein YjbI with pentapeptide repeats
MRGIKENGRKKLQDRSVPTKDTALHCNFCGLSQDRTDVLIAALDVSICADCVKICVDILDAEGYSFGRPEQDLEKLSARHVEILHEGPNAWNSWREKNKGLHPHLSLLDLTGLDLREYKLHHTSFFRTNLANVNFEGSFLAYCNFNLANLERANLRATTLNFSRFQMANLSGCDLMRCHIIEADMQACDCRSADLGKAWLIASDLGGSDFSDADLQDAVLNNSNLVGADFRGANLSRASVFGVSAWNVNLDSAIQHDLRITPQDQPVITVDNLNVAQFVYLLLEKQEIRSVIDTITSKVVLILGRFSPRRKRVLDVLRVALRAQNYLPIMFDFERAKSRDLTETVSLLAHLARFVVVDVTEAKGVPQELQATIANLPSVPFQPILSSGAREYGMFEHFKRFPWVLPLVRYRGPHDLIAKLRDDIITVAEDLALQLAGDPSCRR